MESMEYIEARDCSENSSFKFKIINFLCCLFMIVTNLILFKTNIG